MFSIDRKLTKSYNIENIDFIDNKADIGPGGRFIDGNKDLKDFSFLEKLCTLKGN